MANTTESILAKAINIQRKVVGHNFVDVSHARNGFWMIQTQGFRLGYGCQAHGQSMKKASQGFLDEWTAETATE